MRIRGLWLVVVSMVFLMAVSVTAHSGGTDSKGGHSDGNGGYHYHHGYPPHDHFDIDGDGVNDCPYNFHDKTDHDSGSSGEASNGNSGVNESNSSNEKKNKHSIPRVLREVITVVYAVLSTPIFLCVLSVLWNLLELVLKAIRKVATKLRLVGVLPSQRINFAKILLICSSIVLCAYLCIPNDLQVNLGFYDLNGETPYGWNILGAILAYMLFGLMTCTFLTPSLVMVFWVVPSMVKEKLHGKPSVDKEDLYKSENAFVRLARFCVVLTVSLNYFLHMVGITDKILVMFLVV